MESIFYSLFGVYVAGGVGAAIIAAVFSAIGATIAEVLFGKSNKIGLILTGITAIVAATFSFVYLIDPEIHSSSTTLIVFLTSIVLWAVFFHVGAFHFGYKLSELNLGRWSVLAAKWVRAIDYIYLPLSAISIIKIVVSATAVADNVVLFNAMAAVLLGIAVALRITKTSAEIFDWDKPRSKDTWKEAMSGHARHPRSLVSTFGKKPDSD